MYAFSSYRLKLAERQLERDGQPLALQAKTFDLLVYFVQHPGRLILKEELLKQVWPESHVEESNLTVHVSALRKILGGSVDEYVATVPKYGYRFVAEVRELPVESPIDSRLDAQAESPIAPSLPPLAAVSLRTLASDPAEIPGLRRGPGSFRGWPAVLLIAVSGMATLAFLAQRSRQIWNPVLLTASQQLESTPALSADGRRLVYSLRGTMHSKPDPNKIGLRMRTFASDEVTVLTQQADFGAAWSPDSSELAFIRFVPQPGMVSDAFLALRSLTSGAERVLTKINYRGPSPGPGVTYSPDGKWLITSIGTGFFDGSSPRRLHSVARANGEISSFLNVPPGFIGDSNAVFSPRGDRLAFCRCRSQFSCDLYEVKLSGLKAVGEPEQLTDFGMPEFRPAYLPDGSLLYPSGATYTQRFWRVKRDWLGKASSEQISPAGEDVSQATVAVGSNGVARLVYVRSRVDSNIWHLDLSQRKIKANAAKALITSNQADQTPAYSADGKWIAFSSTRSGMWEIWACASNGDSCRQLTHMGPNQNRNPSWSTDGKWIAFESRGKGEAQIFLCEVSTAITKQLSTGTGAFSDPVWSRDGKYLYFTSNRSGRLEVYRMPAPKDGGIPTQYDQVTSFGGSHPQISLDSQTVLFTGIDLFTYQLKIGSPETLARLPRRGPEDRYFIIMPTAGPGRWAYGILFNGLRSFWGRMDWDNGEVEEFYPARFDRNVSLSLSPDTNHLVWAQTDSTEQDLAMLFPFPY